ncbi:hypothetical protein GCM10010232_53210 [Streptomyces amakusaensis]|uniref:Flavin reductase family protein n=1 Tax=Streptomyces amakusaensis TaxID=67271 RepID=A0ABW0AQY5_9ACTN
MNSPLSPIPAVTTPASATIAQHVEPSQFRSLMTTFPTGVAIVTTGEAEEGLAGLTVSSVSSVSLEPPVLLVCLHKNSNTLKSLLRRCTFAVNLLHDGAGETAKLFASGDQGRFKKVEWEYGPEFGGPHLVNDAHSIADCRISHTLSMGDHHVVFGEVFRVEQQSLERVRPLLYGMRRFFSWPAA